MAGIDRPEMEQHQTLSPGDTKPMVEGLGYGENITFKTRVLDSEGNGTWKDVTSDDYFKDKKVLDIGAFDGFYSFNAEECGAESVTALDGYVWLGKTTATKKGFDIAKQIKGSKVKEVIVDYKCHQSQVHNPIEL